VSCISDLKNFETSSEEKGSRGGNEKTFSVSGEENWQGTLSVERPGT